MTPPTCPTCGLPPEEGSALGGAGPETTARFACPHGHLWMVRWTIRCEVCAHPLGDQDFDPCDPDDGPVTRCEPCDDAVCTAYEKGFADGRKHASVNVNDGGA